ncbi:hypothetical protein KOI40_03065 [Aestuariicella sp. G3-2]|uniref:hypothetical protein n=1 Tax=Pseudomaricurvus albidus TaxID=2842452 RepID=UPI001C0AB02F|nr:hypothetical protein [Aestuariicella albida]MBU3068782.1 hypothetical protein [Aestuariicella albida]
MDQVIEMQKGKNGVWQKTKSFGSKLAVAGTAAMTSAMVFAADHTAEITAAQGDANTNVTAAVAGLIGLVAIVCGVTLLMSLLSRK